MNGAPLITLFPDLGRNTWLARFEADPEARRLFGTDTVPTAFTLECGGEEVRDAVQSLNPGHLVRVVERGGSRPHPEDWPA